MLHLSFRPCNGLAYLVWRSSCNRQDVNPDFVLPLCCRCLPLVKNHWFQLCMWLNSSKMATIDRQNTTGTLSTLYGQSNLQWYFFSIHSVINLRNYWSFHDDVHIVTVPFSSRIRSRTAQRKKLFKCPGDQLKPFLVRVAALKPALSQVDSPFLRPMQGHFPYSVLPFRATSYFRTARWSHGILPYWLFYYVLLPYRLLRPWHTFVLQARSKSFSRSGTSTLSYSVWRPCRPAVPLSTPIASPRRSTVFQLDHWSFLVPNRGVVTRVFVGCRVFGCEMRVKVKLVLEDKLKIWSFESENINELTLPSVLEDVESLFNDELRKRRLHAKLLTLIRILAVRLKLRRTSTCARSLMT